MVHLEQTYFCHNWCKKRFCTKLLKIFWGREGGCSHESSREIKICGRLWNCYCMDCCMDNCKWCILFSDRLWIIHLIINYSDLSRTCSRVISKLVVQKVFCRLIFLNLSSGNSKERWKMIYNETWNAEVGYISPYQYVISVIRYASVSLPDTPCYVSSFYIVVCVLRFGWNVDTKWCIISQPRYSRQFDGLSLPASAYRSCL